MPVLFAALSICHAQSRAQAVAWHPPGQNLPILTRVEQIRRLTPEQAKRAYPVHLRAVVTYYGGPGWEFFVQDSTGGIYVNLGKGSFEGHVGQFVQIEGVTSPGDFAPQVTGPRIQILGDAPLPTPRRASLSRLITGKEDSQWVEVLGLVRRVTQQQGQADLDLLTGDGRCRVRLRSLHDDMTRLVGASVRVRGACGTLFNKHGQLIGIQLYVPSVDLIQVMERSPGPESLPVVPIHSLQKFTLQATENQRVRVRGVVTAARLGEWLYIRDETDGLYIKTAQKTETVAGDRVEVFGFPAGGGYTPCLEDASFSRIGVAQPAVPARITAADALRGDYDAELVSVEARFLGSMSAFDDRVLVLQSGNLVFNAEVRDSVAGAAVAYLKTGSLLQITGVCSVAIDQNSNPESFRLWLRSPNDVAVLERPNSWTLRHTVITLGVVLLVSGAALAWIVALRRQVAAQTASLRRTLIQVENLKNRYQDLFDSANDIIFTTDLTGKLTSLNRMGEIVTGYGKDEALGEEIGQVAVPQQVETMIAKKSSENAQTTYEVEFVRKDGQRVSLEVSSRVMLENGRPAGVVGIARDITERKKAAEELRRAKEAADAANVAKSQFLANISHEIRTPMNGIIGMTALALDTELTPEQSECLTTVKESADVLLEIVNDILDFSKIEAGMLRLDTHPFSLSACLGHALDTIALKADTKGLELVFDLQPGIPDLLVGDKLRLKQIVINLLNNAVKFTEQGEVVLRVVRESETEDTVSLRCTVSDTGIGIPDDKLALIFDAFTQADGSTTRKYGGTGLGLTISKNLVQNMGGCMWAESECGKGSAFHFVLAFRLERPSKELPGAERALTGLPVLVVEDNAITRRILEGMLSSWGMKTTAVESSDLAFAEMEKANAAGKSFAAVLIDGHMAGVDVMGLAQRIRRNPDLARTPIVMLISTSRVGDRARCRTLGISSVVIKPVKPADLLNALLRAVAGEPCEVPSGHATVAANPRPKDSLRILLAEDNEVNQRLALRMLERRGHTVIVARNGREALEAIQTGSFAVVLMDIQMPEMGGFEATAAVREKEKIEGGHIPIIAMTAHAMKGDRERCIAAGMDGYISKPIEEAKLLSALEGLPLSGRQDDI